MFYTFDFLSIKLNRYICWLIKFKGKFKHTHTRAIKGNQALRDKIVQFCGTWGWKSGLYFHIRKLERSCELQCRYVNSSMDCYSFTNKKTNPNDSLRWTTARTRIFWGGQVWWIFFKGDGSFSKVMNLLYVNYHHLWMVSHWEIL